MKLLLITVSLLSILASLSAHAGDYKQFYLLNGKTVDAQAAILGSLKGSEAFRCQSVEAKVSKAGTSIGIKNIKKTN